MESKEIEVGKEYYCYNIDEFVKVVYAMKALDGYWVKTNADKCFWVYAEELEEV